MENLDAIERGATTAVGYWLTDHPISTEGCIEVGVKQAFEAWLNDNSEAVIAAVAGKLGGAGDGSEMVDLLRRINERVMREVSPEGDVATTVAAVAAPTRRDKA